jgi:proline dehydrogenase
MANSGFKRLKRDNNIFAILLVILMLNGFMEKLLAGKWIAGPSVEDAISRGERFRKIGIGAIFNYLGEALTDPKDIEEATGIYLNILDKIEDGDQQFQISIKPTQIGLSVSLDAAKKNLERIISKANEKKIFTWIDMEESELVDKTIELYRSQISTGNVGLCVQSYLRRTKNDVEELSKEGGIFRLVKGAYTEDEKVAFKTKDEINKNYEDILTFMFENTKMFMVASHDELMIEKAVKLSEEHKKEVWYGMLNGIRNQYLIDLQKRGKKTFSYIPFGQKWIQYSVRRMQEAGHISLLMKSMLHGQKV